MIVKLKEFENLILTGKSQSFTLNIVNDRQHFLHERGVISLMIVVQPQVIQINENEQGQFKNSSHTRNLIDYLCYWVVNHRID